MLLQERGFDGFHRSEVSATTWTEPSWLREPAAADRLVVVVLGTNSGSTHTYTSCTVFGTALTNAVNTGTAAVSMMSIFTGYVTTGQTGDIVTVTSAAVPRWAMAVFSYRRGSATAAATASDIAAPMSQNIAQTAGSVMIAGSMGVASEVSRTGWVFPLRRTPLIKVSNVNFCAFKYTSRIAETRTVSNDWDFGAVERFVAVVHA